MKPIKGQRVRTVMGEQVMEVGRTRGGETLWSDGRRDRALPEARPWPE